MNLKNIFSYMIQKHSNNPFNNMHKIFMGIVISLLAISLYGCAKKHPHDLPDAAPKKVPPHLLRTPDAVPKVEPLSKYGNRFKKGTTNVYVTKKRRYHVMNTSKGYRARGKASWYGTKFHGRKTSSGEPYDMYAMTAAHTTLPLPSYIKVTNLKNGKSVTVKVNDRGPFHSNRLLDVSYVAAAKLGILGNGTAEVEIESIDPRDHGGRVQKANIANHLGTKKIALADALKKPAVAATKAIPEKNTKPSVLYLQVGSFDDRTKAEALAKKITALSHAKTYISQTTKTVAKTESKNYQVRIGPMKDGVEADKISKALAKAKMPTATVIKELP
jgi:rare lipoprotein A